MAGHTLDYFKTNFMPDLPPKHNCINTTLLSFQPGFHPDFCPCLMIFAATVRHARTGQPVVKGQQARDIDSHSYLLLF